jgi:hypothetical protein
VLVVSPHDFAEHDAERLGRRFIIARKPAPTRPRINAGNVRKVKFGLGRPREAREISEGDALAVDATDISVRSFGLFSFT